ncbi:hypothetical protein DDB_G0278491 [Dictyostelium discoideum AX4]|uniref:tRNA-uridine aminocarboxypropyltransferase n=1 Tax=Dictyostelium discoideum TaxID=44689 RepID=Q54Y04_DICDI|nr:hypothetical protein DDB_G0278491 [Dictyostelium discoideum AX4]EAL68418.1 hypothetical protein DDB_G0278491 [Dictyostelium discoideum AX4]|eukprot:XP_642398.1 hypothetical protein DDB_G0278491 [Dictyostelium discoideum AX4]
MYSTPPIQNLTSTIQNENENENGNNEIKRKFRKEINNERRLNKMEFKKEFVKPISGENREVNKLIYTQINDGVKERKFSYFKEDLKCNDCWLLLTNCICSKVNKVDLKHEYIFVFHPNEWCRASNTGKLLLLCDKSNFKNRDGGSGSGSGSGGHSTTMSPDYSSSIYNNINNQTFSSSSKIYIMGEKQDEELFFKKLESSSRDSTFVLFPSKDSINIKDVLKSKSIILDNDKLFKKNLNNNEINEKENLNDDDFENDITTITDSIKKINFKDGSDIDKLEKLTIIIADGTWNNAKSLNKRIPKDIKRIHLEFGDLKFKSLFNTIRSQPQVDRISTMEATILSMKSLGESEQVCDSLVESLKLLIDTLIRQNNKQYIVNKKKWVGDQGFLRRNTYGEITTTTTTDNDNGNDNDNRDEENNFNNLDNLDNHFNNNNDNNNPGEIKDPNIDYKQ